MPTNLIGLVLFVILLAPGLVAFTWRAFRPSPTPTVLGELSGLVFRSLICNSLALLVFAGIRWMWPASTPDVGALVRTPADYLRKNYLLVSGWTVALLIAACAFAYVGALFYVQAIEGKGWTASMLQKLVPGNIRAVQPAWWELFLNKPDRSCYVSCILDDGTFLAGILYSFNPSVTESEDRELTLKGPIKYHPPGSTDVEQLGGEPGVNAVCISARRIQYFTVSYLPKKQAKSQPKLRRRMGRAAAGI